MSTRVTIEVREYDAGCQGVILDVRTGREIARTIMRGYTGQDAAERDAERCAKENGWTVLEY